MCGSYQIGSEEDIYNGARGKGLAQLKSGEGGSFEEK